MDKIKFERHSKTINNVMVGIAVIAAMLTVLGLDMGDDTYLMVALFFLSALFGMMLSEMIRRDI